MLSRGLALYFTFRYQCYIRKAHYTLSLWVSYMIQMIQTILVAPVPFRKLFNLSLIPRLSQPALVSCLPIHLSVGVLWAFLNVHLDRCWLRYLDRGLILFLNTAKVLVFKK